jgi:hypothetical protein
MGVFLPSPIASAVFLSIDIGSFVQTLDRGGVEKEI